MANRHRPITRVAATTCQFEAPSYPTEVLLQPPEGGLPMPSAVHLDRIWSIDKRRLGRRLGVLTPVTMGRVDRALLVSPGLVV